MFDALINPSGTPTIPSISFSTLPPLRCFFNLVGGSQSLIFKVPIPLPTGQRSFSLPKLNPFTRRATFFLRCWGDLPVCCSKNPSKVSFFFFIVVDTIPPFLSMVISPPKPGDPPCFADHSPNGPAVFPPPFPMSYFSTVFLFSTGH